MGDFGFLRGDKRGLGFRSGEMEGFGLNSCVKFRFSLKFGGIGGFEFSEFDCDFLYLRLVFLGMLKTCLFSDDNLSPWGVFLNCSKIIKSIPNLNFKLPVIFFNRYLPRCFFCNVNNTDFLFKVVAELLSIKILIP